MLATEAIHGNSHVGSDATAFPDFHTGRFRQCFTQCFCCVYKFCSIHSCGVERRITYLTQGVAYYDNLSKFCSRFEFHGQLCAPGGIYLYGRLLGLITHR